MFIGPAAFYRNPAKKFEHVFPTLIPKTKQKPTDHELMQKYASHPVKKTQKTSMISGIYR